MNRRFFMRTFLLLLLASCNQLHAQDGGGGGSFNFEHEVSASASTPQSPEAAAFARYGDVSVNMYSGTPNIQVPLYTHKGRELDLPISLTYDASGIKVTQRPTYVGLGWNLNAGGRISRMVNNRPDDYEFIIGQPYTSWYSSNVKNQMVEYIQPEYRFPETGDNSTTYGGSKVYNTAAEAQEYLDFLYNIHHRYYETQPDYYSLNAPGLNEMFVLDLHTKQPFALRNPNIKIDIISGSTSSAAGGGVTSFRVTNTDGTKYTFVATEETAIINNNDTYQNFDVAWHTRYTSSWYLTSIVSATGKDTYTFEYTAIVNDYRSEGETSGRTEAITVIRPDPNDWDTDYITQTTSTTYSGRKILNKIKHNGKVIVDASHIETFLNGPDTALNEIAIYSDGNATTGTQLAKKYTLNYSYFKTASNTPINTGNKNFLRLKLDDITIKDANSQVISDYHFDYINPDGMPSLTSYGRDYLGYNNGQFTNSNLIPAIGTNNDYPLNYNITPSLPGANRDTNFGQMSRGTLNRIDYPTGGYSVFEYEQAKVVENGALKNRSGMRIKRILDYADTGTLAKEKQYEYIQAVDLSQPIFEYFTTEISRGDLTGSDLEPYQALHRMSHAMNADKQHIGYTNVREIIVDAQNPTNNISKTYQYNASEGDGIYDGAYQVPITGGNFASAGYSMNPTIGAMIGSSTSHTNTSNTLNNTIIHGETWGISVGTMGRNNDKYPLIVNNTAGNGFRIQLTEGEPIACFGCGPGGLPIGPPPGCSNGDTCTPELSRIALVKTNAYGNHGGDVNRTTTITDGVTTITDYSYTYGDRRFVSKTETTNSDGSISSVEYTYPFQISGYSALTGANMISNPVRVITKPNGVIATTVQTEYNSDLLPTKITTKKGYDITEDRMAFELYDSHHNLLQARQTSGTPVSFIWGYDNRYVIAKIVNVEYANIPTSLINQIKSASDSGNETNLLTYLQNLQNHSSLSEAQMSYYTYKPNIGVTTMTDVTGYRMRYVYDDFQRLVRVEDQDGYILSENEYNYKN